MMKLIQKNESFCDSNISSVVPHDVDESFLEILV